MSLLADTKRQLLLNNLQYNEEIDGFVIWRWVSDGLKTPSLSLSQNNHSVHTVVVVAVFMIFL